MGLRTRVVGLTVLVALVVTGAAYGGGFGIIRSNFERNERVEVEDSLSQVQAVLRIQEDALDAMNQDWAVSDRTYQFVQDPVAHQDFLASDIGSMQNMSSMGADVVVLTNAGGKVVYSGALAPGSVVPTSVPVAVLRYAIAQSASPAGQNSGSKALGLVSAGGTLLAVSAQPIVRSDGSGPVGGTSVLCRYVGSEEVAEIEAATGMRLALLDPAVRSLSQDIPAAASALSREGSIVVAPVDAGTITGYSLLDGLDGSPAVLLRVTQDREELQAGESSMVTAFYLLLVVAVCVTVALYLLLDRMVLSRISVLSSEVGKLTIAGTIRSRVAVKGKDQIADLGGHINAMLDSLEASEAQLAFLSEHDPLTSLPNRRSFGRHLERQLSITTRKHGTGAVVCFGIDRFKDIDNSFGHSAGNEVITEFAEVLRAQARSYAPVARLGGDEFAMLVADAGEEEVVAATMRMLDSLERCTFEVAGHQVRVAVSAGIAMYPEDGDSVETIMARADLAMYHAKETGAGFSRYSDSGEWQSAPAERMMWTERIANALLEDRFVLYAQPTSVLADDSAGVSELLLRMVGEDGQLIPPGDFIPIAEQAGLIRDIDRWVARHAVAALAEDARRPGFQGYAMNISGLALRDGELLEILRSEFARTGADPSKLTVEITETAVVSDITAARVFIEGLRAIGCRVALDDFGSGAASFYYLKHLPVDLLKIDGSLIKDLETDDDDRHLVQAIVEMCRALRIPTVAEFVESAAILDMVRDYGVDIAQGFFIGRPGPR
jgi:diguanylate cyclase (GGDEF)-like protein